MSQIYLISLINYLIILNLECVSQSNYTRLGFLLNNQTLDIQTLWYKDSMNRCVRQDIVTNKCYSEVTCPFNQICGQGLFGGDFEYADCMPNYTLYENETCDDSFNTVTCNTDLCNDTSSDNKLFSEMNSTCKSQEYNFILWYMLLGAAIITFLFLIQSCIKRWLERKQMKVVHQNDGEPEPDLFYHADDHEIEGQEGAIEETKTGN